MMSKRSAPSSSQAAVTKRLRINDDNEDFEETSVPPSPKNKMTATKFGPNSLQRLLFVDLQSGLETVVFSALNKLSSMIKRENVEDLMALGGHSVLLLAMKNWEGSNNIHKMCCICIGAIIFWSPRQYKQKAVSLLLQTGLMPLVFSPLANKSSGGWNALSGPSSVLRGLQGDVTKGAMKAIMELFVSEYEGVSVVLQEMESRPKRGDIQEHGCFLLRLFLDSGLVEAREIKGTALVTVATALQNHPERIFIKKEATRLIKSFLD